MPFTVNGNGNDGGAVPSGPLSADGITARHTFAHDAGCRPTGRSQAGHRHCEQGGGRVRDHLAVVRRGNAERPSPIPPVRCRFYAQDASARNAEGTPGCGTANGAARRTPGTQTGAPPVPPGEGVRVQLAGLGLSGKPERPSQCQFGTAAGRPLAGRRGQSGSREPDGPVPHTGSERRRCGLADEHGLARTRRLPTAIGRDRGKVERPGDRFDAHGASPLRRAAP